MHLLTRRWLGTILLALVAAAVAATPAAAHGSPVVGHVYVNDNSAPINQIAAFDRHADGTLTAEPGSPFSAGGAGAGMGLGSQGSLQVTGDGRYLLAVDAGSNQVSVLRIRHNGTLTLLPGQVVGSNGTEPVSIAVNGGLVYVANAGSTNSNYTGFRLSRDGHLQPLAGSTFPLPNGSQPGDVLFNSTGTSLAGTRVLSGLIDSFKVGPDGLLAAAPGSPVMAQGPGPFGSEFRPTNANQLFVSNAHGGSDNGTVSAFHVAPDGALSSIGSSPFADLQTAPCWVEISHGGRYLFAVNTAVATISSYSITADGSLTLLGSTQMKDAIGLAPVDPRLSPNGDTLWVTDGGGNMVSGFAVHGGNLTELPSSPTPLPAGATPFGIVVN